MTPDQFQKAFWHDLWSRDQPRGSPWARQPGFAVYRNTVLKGCVDNLLALYPAVRRLTGDEWFAALALSYVHDTPPEDARMVCYGGDLPAFLHQHLAHSNMAWLPDVAQLDAQWTQSHIAADAPVWALSEWVEQANAAADPITLVPHPATRWHTCPKWPAFSLWLAAREARPDPNPPHWRGEHTVFTRPGGVVEAHNVGLGTCALLEACAQQATLEEAIAHACDHEPHLDPGTALGLLFSIGAFTTTTP